MSPPELMHRTAPASAGELLLEGLRATAPASRHSGPRAEAAYWRARIEERHAQRDTQGEREAAMALARLLASRGIELDTAVALARRALALGDDPALRAELAGWLASLGEPAMAASALRGVCEVQRPSGGARTLVKIAVLLARASDAGGAVDALVAAASLDPADAMASELIGTISAWAPELVRPEAAAKAYLDAAERREAARERDAAFEDRLRAFEIAPHDPAAAASIAAALLARGRTGASDEAMRAHAAALAARGDADGAIDVHIRRLEAALSEGDPARAAGCALDAQIEADIDAEDADAIDEVLGQAGLYELVAARLELRAERLAGAVRAPAFEALARLYAGPLASPDRALEAWIEAAASDPGCEAAWAALRDHAATLHDLVPLVEALIRIGESGDAEDEQARHDADEQIVALRELAAIAEEKIADPGLACWALQRLRSAGAGAEATGQSLQRLAGRLRAQEEALAAAQRALRSADSADGRVDALRRLVVIFRGRPDERSSYEEALAELARAAPADRGCLLALDRLGRRTGDNAALEAILAERLAEVERAGTTATEADSLRAPALTRVELVRTRLLLAAIHRRQGDERRALEDVVPLLLEAPGHRGASSAALLLATRTGRGRERPDAIVQLAGPVWPGLRAVLLALAAELYAAAGEAALARKVAELACEADPTCARAVAALALLHSEELGASRTDDEGAAAQPGPRTPAGPLDRTVATAIERAITTVLPRGPLCDGLARALEALGELGLSLGWTQRWLALRPGCALATRDLIRRASAARDSARLADALAWVLAQPKPLGDMAPVLADALDVLLDLDRARGVALARRALDVFGPQVTPLRDRMIDLARRAGDMQLGVAVLERWRVSEPEASHAIDLLLVLADCRIDAGDPSGAARELARAAERGADPQEVLERVQRLELWLRDATAQLGSDGVVALTEARAWALTAVEDKPRAAAAWRRLGGLLWDLAEDRSGAEEAFFRASELAPSGGVDRYARDMYEFAGVDQAIETLVARALVDASGASPAEEGAEGADGVDGADGAEAPEEPAPESVPPLEERRRRAGLLLEAATLAAEHGLSDRALAAASSALEIDPSRVEAVALIERCAQGEEGTALLDRTYRLLADAALGCYGRRAAHYRAARQLERRGAVDLALSHAVASFEAVPTEGTTYVLLARLAERAGDPTEAVRALERVAAAGDPEARNAWLKRAAALAGTGEEGARLRVDLLLRALNVRPDSATVEDVGEAIREIVAISGDADAEALRFDRAVKATLPRLDGPDGARAAVAMARVAVRVLGYPAIALAAIERALLADGDIEEFETLLDLIPELTREAERTQHLLAAIYAAARKPHATVGPALLRWASRLADTLGVPDVAASLLVEAARRAPEDHELAFEADVSVQVIGDDGLQRALDDALPVARRIEALLHLADRYEGEGKDDRAVLALQRAVATGELAGEDRARVVARLRRLLTVSERLEELESLLESELARTELPDALRLPMARELASLLAARGDHRAALEVITSAAHRLPFNEELLADVQRLARQADSLRHYVDVLTRFASLLEHDEGAAELALAGALAGNGDPTRAARLMVLRQLAPLVQEVGDHATAMAHYQAIAQLDPTDTRALEALEEDASARGDYAALAEVLAGRIAAAPSADTRRALRLRRAAVLEQRLGLLQEACVELEGLLAASPEDVSALRFLADIYERLGAPLRAAPRWEQLGQLAEAEEKAEYGLRACKAYLDAGEADAAGRCLDAIAGLASHDVVLELRVEIARRQGDARTLADALDVLSDEPRHTPERRAQLLVEAARAASIVGDDGAAIERARRALKVAPEHPSAVLEARRLEYRLCGTGTPREAQGAIEDLNRITHRLDSQHVELHAFLLAEHLDVIQGHGAGMRELTRRHAEIGPATLVALGMAERLALRRNFPAALSLYERALGGDLQGLRSRGRVALAAAQAAERAGDMDAAVRLLEEAAAEPDTRVQATRRQLELTAARGDYDTARRALEQLADRSHGLDRGRVLAQLAGLVSDRDPAYAHQLLAEASSLAGSDRALNARIVELRARLEAVSAPAPSTVSVPAPALPLPGPSAPPPPLPLPHAASPVSLVVEPAPVESRLPPPAALPRVAVIPNPAITLDLGELSEPLQEEELTPTPIAPIALEEDLLDPMPVTARSPGERLSPPPPPVVSLSFPQGLSPIPPSVSSVPPAPVSAPRSLSVTPPPTASEEEAALFRELGAGSFAAGERLIALFKTSLEDRSHETLAVRRMQSALRLGDRGALERLQAAALADKNLVYARAIEHVLHAFDLAPGLGAVPASTRLIPPPLTAQRDASDLVSRLLFRDLDSPVNEALAIVWETGLFRRDAGQYGLTGLERVQPGPATVLGEVYGVVAGRLGYVRTALFHQRGHSALDAQVVPLLPPAVMLRGDVRDDSAELRYLLGAYLAGAMPEHVLVSSMPTDELQTLLSAVVAAFGPLDAAPSASGNPAVVRLEQNLWQMIPRRGERRLREICVDAQRITCAAASGVSRAAMRRAGLYASGDLGVTVQATLKELGIRLAVPLSDPSGLAAACAAHPEIADLVRLSTRMEYAEARWQPGPVAGVRRPDSLRPRYRAG